MNLLERLKDRAVKTKEGLDQERLKDKKLKEQLEKEQVNESAPFYARKDVWCESCLRDYSCMLRKHGNELLAYYLGTCPNNHQVRREITHASTDPYYLKSQRLRIERIQHADDMLTPADDRFKTVYPDKWRELEAAREQRAASEPRGV